MVSDELIILALLEQPSIKKASETAGVSQKTIYNKLENEDFKRKYDRYKTKIIKHQLSRLQGLLAESVETQKEIMLDKEVNPSIRLQASNYIFNNCLKLTETVEVVERIQALEDIYTQNMERGLIEWY